MLKGVHLTLLVGPTVPVPVSQMVLDALTSVEVTLNENAACGFQLSFTLANNSPLHTMFILAGDSPIALMRVILIATVNGTPNVLIDGVATHQQVQPGSEGRSTLSITGEDLTAVMNKEEKTGRQFAGLAIHERVELILKEYSSYGVAPNVIAAALREHPSDKDRIPIQRGTDLAYIRELARQVGHLFFIEPGPEAGKSTAYWGPRIRDGVAQPALNINMDAYTNVESLNFSFNSLSSTNPQVKVQDESGKEPKDLSDPDISTVNPLLGKVPPLQITKEYESHIGGLSEIEAMLRGLARASQSADSVKVTGTLDITRYGTLLKVRKTVGVRGAGYAFDGLYYVTKVTHKIKRGEFKQSFELSRNGLISTVSQVQA